MECDSGYRLAICSRYRGFCELCASSVVFSSWHRGSYGSGPLADGDLIGFRALAYAFSAPDKVASRVKPSALAGEQNVP